MAWIGPVVQAGMGIYQAVSASSAAKKLPDSQRHTVSPEMRKAQAMAERRAEKGFSDGERAAFEQSMARRSNAASRAMRNLGMSGVAQGVSNIFNIDAMNQFSAQSEAEKRKGEAMYTGIAGQIQGLQDRETSSFNQMLQQSRTALGQAGASGLKNITGAFGMAAQQANTNKLAEAYMNSGDTINIGTGTTPTTTTPTTPSVSANGGGFGRVSSVGQDAIGRGDVGSQSPFSVNPTGVFQQGLGQPAQQQAPYNPGSFFQTGTELEGYSTNDSLFSSDNPFYRDFNLQFFNNKP